MPVLPRGGYSSLQVIGAVEAVNMLPMHIDVHLIYHVNNTSPLFVS
jgi:hypothetical protein